jgi:hypothetical protein
LKVEWVGLFVKFGDYNSNSRSLRDDNQKDDCNSKSLPDDNQKGDCKQRQQIPTG